MSMQIEEGEFYQHSGRTGYAIPALFLVGIPLAMLVAAIYSYIVVYVPFVGYVNVVFLAGYVCGLGIPLSYMARLFHCRSHGLLLLTSGLISLCGVYFSWVFLLYALFSKSDNPFPLVPVLLSPGIIWEIAKAVIEEGWWGPSGIVEWVIVSIEAVIMVGGVALIAPGKIDNEVYCEDCNTWCQKTGQRQFSLKEGLEQAARSTESNIDSTGNEAAEDAESKIDWKMPSHLDILKLPEAEEDETPRIVAEVLTCTGCQTTTAIRYSMFSVTVGSNSESKEETEYLPGILLRKPNAVEK